MESENTSRQQSHNDQQLVGQGSAPRPVLRCANCDIDILWEPVYRKGIAFCCTGCADGGPCSCDYSQYHAVNIAGVIHYRPDAG